MIEIKRKNQGCIYPHCEGSSQPSTVRGFTTYAVFTLIARGVHSGQKDHPMNDFAVFTLIARGVHSCKADDRWGFYAVFTLIARGVHSLMMGNRLSRKLYLPSLRGEFTADWSIDTRILCCIYPHCEGSSQHPETAKN